MVEKEIDALWLNPSTNMYYITGFWQSSQDSNITSILSKDRDAIFVAPEMFKEQISKQSWLKDIRSWKEKREFGSILVDIVRELGLSKANVAIEDRSWARFLMGIQKDFPEINFSLASDILKVLRIHKSKEEVRFMKKSGEIAKEIMKMISEKIEVGMSELEISGLIEYEGKKRGSEEMSFKTIASFSKDSAIPHNEPNEKKLKKNDIIMIDLGPRYERYCSDITRTIFMGKISRKATKIYEAIKKAQEKTLSVVRPGIKAYDLNKVVRDTIREYGFEEFFIHGTGHGVGLDIHEEPYLTKENASKIEVGMTFTIEPGIYIPNKFGIRIEDTILVTYDGYDILTDFPKDLLII